MKITLIENGLDSLRKGYEHLETYAHRAKNGAEDSQRFSALKDSVLSVQHGIEILFKFCLEKEHELLLYSDISPKVKLAFKRRRNGEIAELYEAEGVHTVSFKESIERLRDVCGLPIEKGFHETLLKVEGWRNRITHSGVLLREDIVSKVLIDLREELDVFLGAAIGVPYLEGQGRAELDGVYRTTRAVYGELEHSIKALTVERLIKVLKANNIKGVSAPDAFLIKDPETAFSVLQQMQGDGINYGCDLINLHCSGRATITNISSNGVMSIDAEDIRTIYKLSLDAIVVYVPKIKNNQSPLVFIYSKAIKSIGAKPAIRKEEDHKIQYGISLNEDGSELWEKSDYDQSNDDWDADEPVLPPHKSIIRFLSSGPVCFMNVQGLEYGAAARLLDAKGFKTPEELFQAFKKSLATTKAKA